MDAENFVKKKYPTAKATKTDISFYRFGDHMDIYYIDDDTMHLAKGESEEDAWENAMKKIKSNYYDDTKKNSRKNRL